MAEKQESPDLVVRRTSCRTAAANGLLLAAWLAFAVPLIWPVVCGRIDAPPKEIPTSKKGTNYLIVAPPALQAGAEAWAEYRRSTGYKSRILTLTEADASFAVMRGNIQKIYADSGGPFPFYVLLLGHAHPDSSAPDAYLPAGELETGEFAYYLSGAETIASDSMYAAAGDEVRLLPMAIGRIPARDDGDVLRVLARVKQYESQPPAGEGRTRIDLVASDSRFGPQFDALVEHALEYYVTNHLHAFYEWRILNANPASPYHLPAQEFPGAIADRLDGGSLLVMYIGHGMMEHLGPIRTPEGDYIPAFTTDDLSLVHGADRTIAALVGCMIGLYDSAGDQASLAETMLLQPGGVAAAYAASRITSPEGNAVIVKDLLTRMLDDRTATAGEWVRRAESAFAEPASDRALWMRLGRWIIPELHRLSENASAAGAPDIPGELHYNLGQHAYNLFGDPAMKIAYPDEDIKIRAAFPWLPFSSSVGFSGSGKLQAGGSVTVTLLFPPGRVGEGAESLNPNEQANDRTAAQTSVTVGEGGVFSGRLDPPGDLPQGKYILKAVAAGAGKTSVGSQIVYLGGIPADLFLSIKFWWIVISLVLLRSYRTAWVRLIRGIFGRRRAVAPAAA
jgi:hypothetical protein